MIFRACVWLKCTELEEMAFVKGCGFTIVIVWEVISQLQNIYYSNLIRQIIAMLRSLLIKMESLAEK